MTTQITPTFLLKGLDPNKVLADYQSGVFSNIHKLKSPIKLSQNIAILAPVYGSSNHSPVFSFKDRNNSSTIIATTGHKNFEIFTTTGGQLKMGGQCDRCKKAFDHAVMGYPLGCQELTVLTNDDPDPKNGRYRVLYTFWVEGEFCSFECTLNWIRLILAHPADYRDTTLRDSEGMLKMLYKLIYPTAPPLRPAPDPRLKDALSNEEWENRNHVYVRTDRVLMIPAKVEYVQQNFSNPVVSLGHTHDLTMIVSSS